VDNKKKTYTLSYLSHSGTIFTPGTDAKFSVFRTSGTRRNLRVHPTVGLVMSREEKEYVARSLLRFIFLMQPNTNEHIFVSCKDIFMLRVTVTLKSEICVILKDQLMDLALTLFRFHL